MPSQSGVVSFCSRVGSFVAFAVAKAADATASETLQSPPAAVRPFWHSAAHLRTHASFHAGTRCGTEHTARWHASAHASRDDAPHTVTHEPRAGSRDSVPSLRSSRSEAHTRSHAKPGSSAPSRSRAPSLLVGGDDDACFSCCWSWDRRRRRRCRVCGGARGRESGEEDEEGPRDGRGLDRSRPSLGTGRARRRRRRRRRRRAFSRSLSHLSVSVSWRSRRDRMLRSPLATTTGTASAAATKGCMDQLPAPLSAIGVSYFCRCVSFSSCTWRAAVQDKDRLWMSCDWSMSSV